MAPAGSEHEPRLTTGEDLQAICAGMVIPHDAPVTLAEYDPQWPALFDREAARIRAVLGDAAVRVEHRLFNGPPSPAWSPAAAIRVSTSRRPVLQTTRRWSRRCRLDCELRSL